MMLHRCCTTAWLFVGAVLLASCSKGPQPGAVLDEAKQVGRDGASFQHSADDYFRDMDGGVKLTGGEVQGRNMWLVWTGGNDRFWDQHDRLHLRRLRPAQDRRLAPDAEATRRGNRAGTISAWSTSPASRRRPAPDPNRLRPLARPARAGLPARPVRQRSEVPRRADRRARQAARRRHDAAGRLLLRRADRHPRPAPVPESGLRRGGGARPGTRSATTPTRATTTARTWCARTASACPAASAMSGPSPINPPADPENPTGRTSARRSARSTSGSTGSSSALEQAERRTNFMYQLVHTYRPGTHGHLAGLDRLHQQPAHDERGLQSSARGWTWRSARATRSSAAASSTTSSSTTSSPAAR